MKFLRIGWRTVNTLAIESVRFDEEGAAVWLIGKVEPLRANRAEAVALREYMAEVMA